MNIWQQLLTVITALILLPAVIKLLWKLYLFPIGAYFAATRLLWPKYAGANPNLCILIFSMCVLFFVLAWTVKIIRKRRRQQQLAWEIIHNTKPLYVIPDLSE